MSFHSVGGFNAANKVNANPAAAKKAAANFGGGNGVLNAGGSDSVNFSNQLGTGEVPKGISVADMVANVGKMSADQAKAQLHSSTAYGLGLF